MKKSTMVLTEKEELVLKLKVAENAERYDDMLVAVKCLAQEYPEHLVKEDVLRYLSIAYKNCVGQRRCSWRIVNHLPEATSVRKQNIKKCYLASIEAELIKYCSELVNLIDEHLLKVASTPEITVSLLKTKGDYSRYMAEIQSDDDKTASKKCAEMFYEEAMKIAEKEMSPTHPEKLGLALNMSVFYYEISGNPNQACKFAKSVFDSAIADLEHLEERYYKSSTQILQLLRDNLTLWTSEDPDDDSTD